MALSVRVLLVASFLLGVTLLTNPAFAEPKLNGVAVYTELGAEQFIAGLYCETPSSDPRSILLDTGNKRMEVRVLGSTLLSNRFKRMWIEGVAINASAAELQQHAQQLADFSNMLAIKLQRDDNLSISAEGTSVLVQLNKVELGRFTDRQFFEILLRTWIGPVPLSSTFRDGLVTAGKIDDKQLSIYTKVDATPQRISAIKAALIANGKNKPKKDPEQPSNKEETPVEKTQVAKTEATVPKPPTEKPESKLAETKNATPPLVKPSESLPDVADKIVSKPSEATPAETAKQKPEPQVAETKKPNEPIAKIAEKTPAKLIETAPLAVAAAATSAAAAATTPAAVKAISANAIFENDDEQETADSLLVQQLYISKLSKRAAGFVKYPSEALQKNQTGSVRLMVTINRSGAVTNISAASNSEFASLNQAAIEAARGAAPYPPIPSEIKANSFVFSVPFAFRIKGK